MTFNDVIEAIEAMPEIEWAIMKNGIIRTRKTCDCPLQAIVRQRYRDRHLSRPEEYKISLPQVVAELDLGERDPDRVFYRTIDAADNIISTPERRRDRDRLLAACRLQVVL